MTSRSTSLDGLCILSQSEVKGVEGKVKKRVAQCPMRKEDAAEGKAVCDVSAAVRAD